MQDNSYKLWRYDGKLLKEEKVEAISMAFFKNQEAQKFPLKKPSPRLYEKKAEIQNNSAPKKYVPPQLRSASNSNSVSQMLSQLRDTSSSSSSSSNFTRGNYSGGPFSGSSNPNNTAPSLPFGFGGEPELKKKNKKKKKKNPAQNNSGSNDNNSNTPPQSSPPQSVPSQNNNGGNNNQNSVLSNLQKTLKKVNKKLKDIERLKSTPSLDQSQINKISTEKDLLEQKKTLEKQISEQKNKK